MTHSNLDSVDELRKRPSGAFLGEKTHSTEDKAASPTSSFPEFDTLPEFLRIGPWSPLAFIYLLAFGIWLMATSVYALEAFRHQLETLQPGDGEQRIRSALLAGYCLFINAYAYKNYGPYPYMSYTMLAYAFLTIRFASNAFGFLWIAEALRFPVVVMAWITTSVWWIVLVPLLCFLMPGGSQARWNFICFNFSFFLLNVHLGNLALAMFDHQTSWRPFTFFDLWISLMTAFLYVLFYLNVLDRNGIHFYIILSPRPWWCIFVYSGIIGLYVCIYCALG